MGDERGSANESENLAATTASVSEPAPALVAPRPGAQPPRPVSLPPRPSSTPSSLAPRAPGTPPPPPVRSLLRASLTPPPPSAVPPALPSAPPPPNSGFRPPPPSMRPAPPSVAPAPPAPPIVRTPSVAVVAAPRVDGGRVQELLSDLMRVRKELTEKSTELRKTISERNTLRARLVRAENSARELSSAFRAEAQLRSEFVDAHAANSAALRARVAELEAALASAKSEPKQSEQVGLRRIRGIGPAYERALLGIGITHISQIAALTPEEIVKIAPQIKAQADRIQRDDWVGQAQRLIDESSAK
jgi:predicted flap endonuclease-1-like 5' DNA nuclease